MINILREISYVYVDKFEMTYAKVKKKLLKVASLCEAIGKFVLVSTFHRIKFIIKGSSAYLSLESNIFEKQTKKVL